MAEDGGRSLAAASLLVALVTAVPYALNALAPPPGTAFLGTFYYVDDFYNYLSYAQQAEGGRFLLANKAVLEPHAPALVNLEWLAVGLLARVFGGGGDGLFLAYRTLGFLATVAFVLVAGAWLRRLGLPPPYRTSALLLVCFGGGLGGALVLVQGRSIQSCLDLFTGLFPFVGFLTNPHFTLGTTLLLLGLLLHERAGEGAHPGHAIAAAGVASALALVRPYDFVLLVVVRGLSVLLLEPMRAWGKALLPFAAQLPVAAYLYWLFFRNPAYAFYSSAVYEFPALLYFAWAIGPAALLALAGLMTTAPDDRARRARQHLRVWAGLGVVVIALRPVGFSLQLLVGFGFCLLALGACALPRWSPRTSLALCAAFGFTFTFAFVYFLVPRGHWLMGRDTRELVRALEQGCSEDDLLFAPPTVGLFAYGLTPCRSFLSHAITPGHAERREETERFTAQAPAERLALLDRHGVTRLVLPEDAGESPLVWLGPGSGFRRVSAFGPGLILYARP